MKQFLLAALSAAALLLSACGKKSEQAAVVPRQYTAFRPTEEIVIDGLLDEPSWEKAAPTADFADISGPGFPEPLQRTFAKMLWDEDFLYIGAWIAETDVQAHLTQRDTIIWKENDFEVFLDPQGEGRGYFELETNATGVLFDLLMSKPYSEGGNFFAGWDCRDIRLATHIDGTLNDSGDTDQGWTVEMAIPTASVGWGFDNPIGPGKTWRVNFSRVEWNGTPEDNWVWSPTGKVDMHLPHLWGKVTFVDETVR